MVQVRQAHCSSLGSGSVKALSDQVARGAEHTDPSCNLMTWTEIYTADRAKQLKADGWGTYAPHQETDAAFMWRKQRWKLVKSSTHRLTDKTWVVSGHTHKLVSAKVVLEAQDGSGIIWLSVTHFPSGVQGKGGFKTDNPDAVAAWKSGLKGMADWKAAQHDKWHPQWMGMCADWNIDFKLGWCRDIVKQEFP